MSEPRRHVRITRLIYVTLSGRMNTLDVTNRFFFGFPTSSDTNQTVQPQKMANDLEIRIYKQQVNCPQWQRKTKAQVRARFHEQSLFAKYLHAFVSDFQNKCHLKCFNCLSILRNRYNPMKNRYSRLQGV